MWLLCRDFLSERHLIAVNASFPAVRSWTFKFITEHADSINSLKLFLSAASSPINAIRYE